MRIARGRGIVALLLAIIGATGLGLTGLGLTGCAASSRTPRPNVTGGRHLEMLVSSAERRYERYRVAPDGVLHWAGGANAQSSRFTWSGPLTAEEIDLLFGAIVRDGWFERDPPSTKEPPDTVYDVRIRGPEGRESFVVTGDTEGLLEVRRILEQAARRRLDGVLEALPGPGPRTR
jgi:hypothetical protein